MKYPSKKLLRALAEADKIEQVHKIMHDIINTDDSDTEHVKKNKVSTKNLKKIINIHF